MNIRLVTQFFLSVCFCTMTERLVCGFTPAEPNEPAKGGQKQLVLHLDFNAEASPLPASASLALGAKIEEIGPTSEGFLGLPQRNPALRLDGQGAHVRIADDAEAEASPLDFTLEDAITLEAWVRLDRLGAGANVYVIGKGRTYETQRLENQNYALRLTGAAGEARPSFLFATKPAVDGESQYHRWTAERGFVPDGLWHHIAIGYRFGTPESIVGVVDGEKVKGKWDMAGSSKAAPIMDNDAVWIGSARAGDKGNSLAGAIDDVMIHREIVPISILSQRRQPVTRPPDFPTQHTDTQVTITLHPGLSSHSAWPAQAPPAEYAWTSSHLAVHRLPLRYITGGIRQQWRGPLLLRAHSRIELPAGEMTWLVRSPGLSRLWIDGQVVMTTPAHRLFPDAHQPFEVYEADHPWLRVPRAGDTEKRATLTLSAGKHEIVLEQIVGAKNIRCETGDTTVAVRRGDELFTLLGPVPFEVPLSDEGWTSFETALESQMAAADRQLRRQASAEEDAFWQRRHELARAELSTHPSITPPASTAGLNEASDQAGLIDRFINADLAGRVEPEQLQSFNTLASDSIFLRRLYLDTVGVLPSAEQTRQFLADQAPNKRQVLIDRLLADNRWADHWTSYWQDVLAENPSILKPTLNNTGPFRWWIHDAFVENKPMDRFVTELIRMEGDRLGGGAAGFSMASENDVPMAAKAHILTAAFLGVEMKCARCHDAPFHPWTQKELFGLAAMLDNKPIKVPASSSVPKEFFERKQGAAPMSLSIFPGDEIAPQWPFDDLNADAPADEMLGRDNPSRERLAAYITSPKNTRFTEVMVNRLWQRVMGWGMITHLGDWHQQDPRHPELLKHLAREFVANGYDYKHVARLIFNSHAYQRVAIDGHQAKAAVAFASPWIRRLTAEQVVDSLHELAGLPLGTEEITFDPSTQQNIESFLNLGEARRAWQLTSLSNERDRPSLSLPKAALVVECLEAFGWRGARQEPVSHRETDANMVQPGVIANSALSVRLSRMSEESYFTQLALQTKTPAEFVTSAFEQVLSREPSQDELQSFVDLIQDGWNDRIVSLAIPPSQPKPHRGFVTWANHFDIRANQLMRDIERELAAGPAPSARLKTAWREQAEDAIWALMNTPEFQFVP
ncbi:MAG: DUF1553 domain-containing protein [Pirellulaceae bacterium]|nr:DUF1553 domain-containing protein [Pirellulaceae bacterium]